MSIMLIKLVRNFGKILSLPSRIMYIIVPELVKLSFTQRIHIDEPLFLQKVPVFFFLSKTALNQIL